MASAIKGLVGRMPASPEESNLTSIKIRSVPTESIFSPIVSATPIEQPIQTRNQILIQVHPSTSSKELENLISEYKLRVIKVIPELGIILANILDITPEENAPKVFTSIDNLRTDTSNLLSIKLENDPRVFSATPNTVISTHNLKSTPSSKSIEASSSTIDQQVVDWGIRNIKADRYWGDEEYENKVGVIDVGFGVHQDINLIPGSSFNAKPHNHGLHVSGIMCAKHNETGTKGVLKNCEVRFDTLHNILETIDPIILSPNDPNSNSPEYNWASHFFEYLATLNEYIHSNEDIKIINVSLGYNWNLNFNHDPRSDDVLKNSIKGQGRMVMSLLLLASQKDIILVSATGNDSKSLSSPLESKWASPFNFGSELLEAYQGWSNGVVVQSHDMNFKRSDFSNIGGDISCPGEGVISLLSTPENAIGPMDGTSMASPYCAAGIQLIRNKRPDLPIKDLIKCAKFSNTFVDGTVPALDIEFAIGNCRALASAGSRSEQLDIINFLTQQVESQSTTFFHDSITSTVKKDSCKAEHILKIKIEKYVALGDGGIQSFKDSTLEGKLFQFIKKLKDSNCDPTIFIVVKNIPGKNNRDSQYFSYLVQRSLLKQDYSGSIATVNWLSKKDSESETLLITTDGNNIKSLADRRTDKTNHPEHFGLYRAFDGFCKAICR